jgi:hypothetical protein
VVGLVVEHADLESLAARQVSPQEL